VKIFLSLLIFTILSSKGGLVAQGPCEDIAKVRARWWANWETINHCPDVDAKFVPHVVCQAIPDSLPEGAIWAMGPNEVNYDLPGSTCPMTPQEAAQVMRRLNTVFPDVRWVGPSVSACYPNRDPKCLRDPVEWMDEYMALCHDCQDAIAVHWYCYDGRPLIPYLDEMGKYGLPIWLTEWGCDDLGQAQGALNVIKDKTARHAWFALRLDPKEWEPPILDQTLVDQDGNLTELGKLYEVR